MSAMDCSEEEAPQTPPCAGRTAAASPPAGCGAADVQDDVGKVELPGEGDGLPEADTFGFDLQAFDAADEEGTDLWFFERWSIAMTLVVYPQQRMVRVMIRWAGAHEIGRMESSK
eukprot:symbB.v1.2.016994.t1/scaffold1310.1/size127145/8